MKNIIRAYNYIDVMLLSDVLVIYYSYEYTYLDTCIYNLGLFKIIKNVFLVFVTCVGWLI